MGFMVSMPSPKIDFNRKAPFAQAYWVVPDRLMAGYYPGSALGRDGDAQLNALLKCGIRHFINDFGISSGTEVA